MRILGIAIIVFNAFIFPCSAKSTGSQTEAPKLTLAQQKEVHDVFQVALQWLQKLDQKKYAKAWDESADYFKKIVPKKKWLIDIQTVRSPLGRTISRRKQSHQKMKGIPGGPKGEYIVFQIDTQFQNKPTAVETVVPLKGKDGKWRVTGYYVK